MEVVGVGAGGGGRLLMIGKDFVLLVSESEDSTLRIGGRPEFGAVEIMEEKLPGALSRGVFELESPDMVACVRCA